MKKVRKAKVKHGIKKHIKIWESIHNNFDSKPNQPEDAKITARKPSVDPHHLAEQVLDANYKHNGSFTLRYYRGGWYYWRNTHYHILPAKELRAHTNKSLRQIFDASASDKQVVRQIVENVTMALEGMCLVDGHLEMPRWLDNSSSGTLQQLSMNNGLLDLEAALSEDKATLRNPSPDWFCMSHWDYNYDPTAECTKWISFLKEVLPHQEQRQLLQEFLGYCLTFDTSFHKALILVGEGANGKSVVTEVATQLIGINNVSHVGLERFGERFSLAPIIGRLANIVSEISRTRSVDEGMLKALISGDLIRIERKYQDPLDARPTARLIFATNEIPNFIDRSDGLWRRLLILPFNITIPEEKQDRALARKICQTELPGIFNWALLGLKRLRKNECFAVPLSSKQLLEKHKNVSNPARHFLTERYTEDKRKKVECETVYSQYTEWCREQSLFPLTMQQFGQEVRRVFPSVERKQFRLRMGRTRLYYYVGLNQS